MSFSKINIEILDKSTKYKPTDSTGISLHCHTLYSKEMLDFVPYYAKQIPIASWLYERESTRYFQSEGRRPNFNLGYWEPPLTGHQLFESEKLSIEQLDLRAVVSITDHDSIQANLDVNAGIDNSIAPISMEWTVPYRTAYFHVGVHNLPPNRAEAISRELLDHTFDPAGPNDGRLNELFEMLNGIADVLIVFNHPLWDIEMIGQPAHKEALEAFLAEYGQWFHALEINGYRPWPENEGVIQLAERAALPLISGGDRHCLGANTMINTSRSQCFSEFVDEIRADKRSNIVILPEYQLPLIYRQIRSISQILGHYPAFPPERRHWSQRVFFDAEDGSGPVPLSTHWNGRGPRWHEWAIGIITLMSHRSARPLFQLINPANELQPSRNNGLRTNKLFNPDPVAAEQ